jgi:hypothetical protein
MDVEKLIVILYKGTRNVLNNNHIDIYMASEQTHPPAKGKTKYINEQNFCERMWKKNFQNLKTVCVYGGVDHSIQRPPVRFERLGYPP